MKVQWIEFENRKTGLRIERIAFNEDITLLVGLSGVGKTLILNAVKYTLNLAINKAVALRPYKVGIGILVDGDLYEWFFEINKLNENLIIDEGGKFYFYYEKLERNGTIIFERDDENIYVAGYDRVPQPKKDESLLLQYAENENLKDLVAGIRKLYSVDIELDVRGGIHSESFSRLKSQVETLLQNNKGNVEFKLFSHLPAPFKLYMAKRYYFDIYVKIFDKVKELFMEIEDIDVVEDRMREMYLVSIQVYGKKLLQHDISNGMLKTIYYFVELYTMSEQALVLIDEFENGLGVNCIDLLSELMLWERKDLQFIITSHHPSIINAVDKSRWKIIDRNGSTVINTNSEAYGIGNSQHDAYFNLINRWNYEGKI